MTTDLPEDREGPMLWRFPRRRLGRRTRGLLFSAAVAVHLVVLYLPSTSGVPGVQGLDTLVHMLVFGAVLYTGVRFGLPAVPVVLVLLAHGVLSELVQHYALPNRSGDWHDSAADVIGVALAYLLLRERR